MIHLVSFLFFLSYFDLFVDIIMTALLHSLSPSFHLTPQPPLSLILSSLSLLLSLLSLYPYVYFLSNSISLLHSIFSDFLSLCWYLPFVWRSSSVPAIFAMTQTTHTDALWSPMEKALFVLVCMFTTLEKPLFSPLIT